jgi:hypothetical protein
MTLTRQIAAQKLIDYLQHHTTASDLVDWAETMMMDEEFEEEHYELLRDRLARRTGRRASLWPYLGRLRGFPLTTGV